MQPLRQFKACINADGVNMIEFVKDYSIAYLTAIEQSRRERSVKHIILRNGEVLLGYKDEINKKEDILLSSFHSGICHYEMTNLKLIHKLD